jgi:hypothetical protein
MNKKKPVPRGTGFGSPAPAIYKMRVMKKIDAAVLANMINKPSAFSLLIVSM